VDGHVDVGGVAARDLRKRLAVGRIEHLDAQAGVWCHQAVGDEVLGVHWGFLGGSGTFDSRTGGRVPPAIMPAAKSFHAFVFSIR